MFADGCCVVCYVVTMVVNIVVWGCLHEMFALDAGGLGDYWFVVCGFPGFSLCLVDIDLMVVYVVLLLISLCYVCSLLDMNSHYYFELLSGWVLGWVWLRVWLWWVVNLGYGCVCLITCGLSFV